MRLRNSSISSSERRRRRWRAVLATSGWTLLVLILLDLAVQLVFPMPASPRQEPRSLARYFDYGRSIEGKLAYIVQPSDAASSPIVAAGWIDAECGKVAAPPPPGKLGISLYGMSFTDHIARNLVAIDPTLPVKTYDGPGAGFNHSYACYEKVSATGRDPNKVQIIGILASEVGRMLTLGGLTSSFEAPQPFTYPRYHLAGGRLTKVEPIVRSADDLRDPAKMQAYFAQLAHEDAFYDPLLAHGRLFDNSVTLRLLRRAYAQSRGREITATQVHDGKSYVVDNPELGPVMGAMLHDFATSARAQDKIPMIILLQDRGFGADSLYRMLGPALARDHIAVIRSDQIAAATDPRNFIPDGHFTPEVDRKLAEAVHAWLKQLPAQDAAGPA